MRRLSEKTWHLLLITLWGIPLIMPLLHLTAVTCTHDGHLHYHRIAAMRHAWQNGLYFSRWLPDLAFGYGYPFFIYREPIPLYASLIPHLLGLPLPAAENLVYILGIWAAGWFMYLWVRDVLGARAGLVAGMAYMAAPYVLVDALIRGNAPESVALPFMPLLLWIGRRWLINGRWQSFLVAVIALALFALSHNISLLLFTPFLLIYLLLIGWLHQIGWQTTAVRLILLFGLGLGMTSFYTGGALLEMDAVTLSQSTTTRNNDFRYNFASLNEILAPVTAEDPTLINPPLPFRLGWATVGLAFAGIIAFLLRGQATATNHRAKERTAHVLLMMALTAVYLLLSLAISRPLWEGLPLIEFTQFPWRFIGRAALPLAFLAGLFWQDNLPPTIGRWHLPTTLHSISLYAALSLLLLEAIPQLYPTICYEEPFPTIQTVHQYEAETGLVGVDPEGSYFPKTVGRRPQTSPLLADYAAGTQVQRWDTAVLPSGTEIIAESYQNLAATLHLNSPEPFTARYYSFAFPGWTAVIDGKPVNITPSHPEGLISFPVPAGEHTLIVRWQSTPLRSLLLGLSLMALAGLLITTLILASEQKSTQAKPATHQPANHKQLLSLLAIGLALLLLKIGWIDRSETIFRRPSAPNLAVPLALQGNELRLLGYNISQTAVASGSSFDVDMAWLTLAPPAAQYQSNIWLEDAAGLLWSDKETHRPRLYEDVPDTRFWQPGQWAWDSREVATLSGIPPGDYRLVLTLFERETLQPLTLVDAESGAVVGPTAVIATITITPPRAEAEFRPQYPLATAVHTAHLLGYNQDRQQAKPGEALLLTFFWQESANESLSLSLGQDGVTLRQWAIHLPNGRYRSQHLINLPANLDSGTYSLALDALPFGTVQINAPARLFEQPLLATAVHTPFHTADGRQQATLVGYTLPPPTSTSLSLSLIWQANAEMSQSYRVFIHLVDEQGAILAQADGEPANWLRPTTGWAVGEYIIDEHALTLPAEAAGQSLWLRVGLYDVATGERLKLETADHIAIPLQQP